MSTDTQWQLAGWLQLTAALGLPAALFLAARHWHFWVRLALAVVIAWIASVFVQGVVSPINEAHHLTHYRYNPANMDDYGPSYDDTTANGLTLFFGWLPPLCICLLIAGILWLVGPTQQHTTTSTRTT